MLYFALVSRLGELPAAYEMAEILLSDKLTDNLTYPDIQPALYLRIQDWLNNRSNAEELWDVYDENQNLADKQSLR